MRNEMFSKNAAMLGGAAKQKAPIYDRGFAFLGAQERTRTSTVLPPPGPEPGASTNFATWASLKKATL